MPDIQTNDELTDKINAALEAEPDEVVTPSEETTPVEEVEPKVEETGESTEQTSTEPTQPDYKQKFVESSRESILNAERVKVANARIEQLTKQDTPTDDAMRQLYPDWDDYNEVTKRAFIKIEANELKQRKQDAELEEWRAEKQLNAQIQSILESEPKLAGKESEFKRFASNPKNKGISADVLAKAFLFDVQDETPATPNIDRTEALPQGNGGSREPLKPKKISLSEAALIRKTDNARYMELVKSGMIDDDID